MPLHSESRYLARVATRRFATLRESFRKHGVSGIADRLLYHLRWKRSYRQVDAEFDGGRIDTKGPISLWRLGVHSENLRYANRYEGVHPGTLRSALYAIGRSLQGFSFIDLGCGKGRALIIAAEFSFSQLIGVEFAPSLASIAEANCKRLRISATILCQDAATFQFAPGNSVVFLFNPFGPAVLHPVVDHLTRIASGERYVIYLNPAHRDCFDLHPRMRCVRNESAYSIWTVTPRTS